MSYCKITDGVITAWGLNSTQITKRGQSVEEYVFVLPTDKPLINPKIQFIVSGKPELVSGTPKQVWVVVDKSLKQLQEELKEAVRQACSQDFVVTVLDNFNIEASEGSLLSLQRGLKYNKLKLRDANNFFHEVTLEELEKVVNYVELSLIERLHWKWETVDTLEAATLETIWDVPLAFIPPTFE